MLIKMVQISDDFLAKPLSMIFQNLKSGIFHVESNVVSIHKKSDKQLIHSYRALSFLPICSKIFDRVISNSIFRRK